MTELTFTPAVDRNVTVASAANVDVTLTATVDVDISFSQPGGGSDPFAEKRRDYQDFEDVSGTFSDFAELKEAS